MGRGEEEDKGMVGIALPVGCAHSLAFFLSHCLVKLEEGVPRGELS